MYKIIKIIDDMSVIVNCGTNQGIKEGDLFYIRSKKTEKVVDPDTNEVLGEFNRFKAKIEAVNVLEKMCICKNALKTASITDLAKLSLSGGQRQELNVDPEQISGGLFDAEDELIHIGDLVDKINKTN